MTSRQRVKKAVSHEKPDRYPIDLGIIFASGISVFAYYNLRKYLGLSIDNIQLADSVQMLARVDDDIRELFHIDTINILPPFARQKRWNVRGEYSFLIPEQMNVELQSNGDYIIKRGDERMRLPKNGYFADGNWIQIYDCYGDDLIKYFGRQSELLSKESDKYFSLTGPFLGFFTGIEMACDMLTDPDSVHAYNKNMLAEQKRMFDIFVEAGGKDVDDVNLNADLGMQNGPMLSPDCYEDFVMPYVKEFTDYIHTKTTDARISTHCCGSIEPLIPLLIEGGIQILNPVQISASNMDPKMLKKKYGKKIAFWGGGCNTQQVLNMSGEKEVRENVKMLTDIFKEDGGFVFNQVHNIMGDIKPQNIIAMFDEAYKNSGY